MNKTATDDYSLASSLGGVSGRVLPKPNHTKAYRDLSALPLPPFLILILRIWAVISKYGIYFRSAMEPKRRKFNKLYCQHCEQEVSKSTWYVHHNQY